MKTPTCKQTRPSQEVVTTALENLLTFRRRECRKRLRKSGCLVTQIVEDGDHAKALLGHWGGSKSERRIY